MSALLELHQIHAAYGNAPALFGVSLEVASGECVCLLGRNGVGALRPMIERSVVVLPTPLRPRRHTHSPDATSNETPNKAGAFPYAAWI